MIGSDLREILLFTMCVCGGAQSLTVTTSIPRHHEYEPGRSFGSPGVGILLGFRSSLERDSPKETAGPDENRYELRRSSASLCPGVNFRCVNHLQNRRHRSANSQRSRRYRSMLGRLPELRRQLNAGTDLLSAKWRAP